MMNVGRWEVEELAEKFRREMRALKWSLVRTQSRLLGVEEQLRERQPKRRTQRLKPHEPENLPLFRLVIGSET